MKYAPKLNSPRDRIGVWGPVTATLDWCEDNYEYSPYVAELWNTVSNLAMILPALFGVWQAYKMGLERRFTMCFLTLLFVGFGSWLFHATLSHSMQLVDELSMLFTASVMLYVAWESRSPYKQPNNLLAFGLLAGCLSVSAAYIVVKHPLFHQLAYAAMVVIVVLCSFSILREHPRYMRLYLGSVSAYTIGFICWEIDVHGCNHLRKVRTALSEQLLLACVASGLTQLHAWWHVLAGLGTYGHIVAMCSTRSIILGRPKDISYCCGLIPVLNADSKAKVGKDM